MTVCVAVCVSMCVCGYAEGDAGGSTSIELFSLREQSCA